MDIKKQLNFKNLIYIYGVSNTPAFLFRNMRRDASIDFIANNYSSGELINEFNQRSNREITNIADLVVLYSIFIALTYKEYNEVKKFFLEARDIPFEWFSDIASIFLQSYMGDNVIKEQSKFDPEYTVVQEDNLTNENSKKIEIENEPYITTQLTINNK